MIDYKELKVGLEIHIQLDTQKKLFCNCSTKMMEKPIGKIIRKLHPTYSELGEIDEAAMYEYLKDKTFVYYIYKNETCLVELDEEPPHEVNKEALEIALQIALLFNCKVPEEIQVMRKIVIDGSNTSGFQRTMLIGYDGYFEYKGKKIRIPTIYLEEDAAAKEKEENGKVYYRLNRLGIPLVEIDTEVLTGFSPKEIEEIAYYIWLIASSTRKVKKVIGAIRQDVNISIFNNERVEIKGVQELSLISKVIEYEIKRQLEILKRGEKIKKETRAAKQDGTTEFMRPLPGAERMYPETDIKPIKTTEIIKKIKLPERIDKIIERYEKQYKLSKDLINSLLKSGYFFDFEDYVKKFNLEPKIIANVFGNILVNLRRKNLEIDIETVNEVLKKLEKGEILKESIEKILEYCFEKKVNVEKAIEDLNLKILSDEELEKIILETVKEVERKDKIFGVIMKKVRGKASAEKVMEILKKLNINQ